MAPCITAPSSSPRIRSWRPASLRRLGLHPAPAIHRTAWCPGISSSNFRDSTGGRTHCRGLAAASSTSGHSGRMRPRRFVSPLSTLTVTPSTGMRTWSAAVASPPGRNSSSSATCASVRPSGAIRWGELRLLRQTGTVSEYQSRFLALLSRADPLSDRQERQMFTSGLHDDIRSDVELQDPQDLEHALALARAFEKRAAHPVMHSGAYRTYQQPRPPPAPALPMADSSPLRTI
jgi:hypothetical protein